MDFDAIHFCWEQCCDRGPHACICGNDCKPGVEDPTSEDIERLGLKRESWKEYPSDHPFIHCEIVYSGEDLESVTWHGPAGPVDFTENYRRWTDSLPTQTRWVTPTREKRR